MDPDTNEEIQDAKRPRIQLDESKKVSCLKALVSAYGPITAAIINKPKEAMDVDAAADPALDAVKDLSVCAQITNILFTLHTICRQVAMGRTDTNAAKKTLTTAMTVSYNGKEYQQNRDMLIEVWKAIVLGVGLEYKKFNDNDDDNWYGTMGPYLDFFCGFGLRLKELRIGHDKMPITRSDGVTTEFPVRKYGLTGAHHVLLEGCTFPPEKRSSMAQSMGPMTAFLCMIRSEGMYRQKWASAVKRAFNHIPIIDDIIEVTKTQKKAQDISTTIGLLAEIILITTSRQATRMFFPLSFLSSVYEDMKKSKKQDKLLKFFNTTGSGGFFLYKMACKKPWKISGTFTEETAGQVVFHSIFGTYKEDFGILSTITNVANWQTREQIGKGFTKGEHHDGRCAVKLPILSYYSKMSCANQSGLLTGVYNQVVGVPSFSGRRVQLFGNDFFEHLEKKVLT